MIASSSSPDNGTLISGSTKQAPSRIPVRLQREAKWATIVLFATWLFVSAPVLLSSGLEIVSCFALLPGLAMAGYLACVLNRSLGANHREDEPHHLFSTLGAGNWISLVRAALVVGLACLLPLSITHEPPWKNLLGWFAGTVYLTISLVDLLDGYVARKQQRVTELGKILDIETDAAGLLAATLVAILLGRLPTIYLLVALSYYLFIFGMWWRARQNLPVAELVQRPYGRIIAGSQMGLVALVLFPVFASTYTHIGAIVFMAPFLLGFVRDWLVVSCRVRTDANQYCRIDDFFGKSLSRSVPLFARLLIALAGVYVILTNQVSPANLIWSIGYIICWGSVVVGFLGRSAALVLLLLLGLNVSPLGVSFFALISFVSASALFLIGSGSLSIWAPEENILYRRPTKPALNGEAG